MALTAVTLILSSPNTGRAQSNDVEMKINIPFDFYIGSKKLPAGNYRLTQPAHANSAVFISGEHGATPVLTTPATNHGGSMAASVVFNKYADEVFMSEVRWPGSAISRRLPQSPMEIRLARNVAAERVIAAGRRQ
jgi:hypothetical protein